MKRPLESASESGVADDGQVLQQEDAVEAQGEDVAEQQQHAAHANMHSALPSAKRRRLQRADSADSYLRGTELLHQLHEAQQLASAAQSSADLAKCQAELAKCVDLLEHTHEDHIARVQGTLEAGCDPHPTASCLWEMVQLQQKAELCPASEDIPLLYPVTDAMVQRWESDVEEVQAALRGEMLDPIILVSAEQASTVINHLRVMLQTLQNAQDSQQQLPRMEMLLLCKKLHMIDQMRPADNAGATDQPWQVVELQALLAQAVSHPLVFAQLLRWPSYLFAESQHQIDLHAAKLYARAAVSAAARGEYGHTARLMVQQCKVLQRAECLHLALHLKDVKPPTPSLLLVRQIHTNVPAAGPPPRLDMVTLSKEEWAAALSSVSADAATREMKLQQARNEDTSNMSRRQQRRHSRHVAKLREKAHHAQTKAVKLSKHSTSLRAARLQSLRVLHPDQRPGHATAGTEFDRARKAWEELIMYNEAAPQLREFQSLHQQAMEQQQQAAAAEAASTAAAAAEEEEEGEGAGEELEDDAQVSPLAVMEDEEPFTYAEIPGS